AGKKARRERAGGAEERWLAATETSRVRAGFGTCTNEPPRSWGSAGYLRRLARTDRESSRLAQATAGCTWLRISAQASRSVASSPATSSSAGWLLCRLA